jgi:cobalamin-dependent methionine synthase I
LIKEEKFSEALDIARHQVEGGAQILMSILMTACLMENTAW